MPGGEGFNETLVDAFKRTSDTWIDGAFALEQGFILTSMILAALTVCIIEKQFKQAAIWSASAAFFSLVGFMHSFTWTFGDTVSSLQPAIPWAIGYGCMALLFALAPFITEEGQGH